ncbi:hypothetical protein OH76DRAFT_176086 [Lentinus brumalis]|uniref:Uncharacterized protein n=1 Tax=Lentinus brumalis TaxID=2498619 RepID=A0A371CNN0_9APHY|nr:hypothetical protein OH76DRAFT_176086 [Polyporus brumalis]
MGVYSSTRRSSLPPPPPGRLLAPAHYSHSNHTESWRNIVESSHRTPGCTPTLFLLGEPCPSHRAPSLLSALSLSSASDRLRHPLPRPRDSNLAISEHPSSSRQILRTKSK